VPAPRRRPARWARHAFAAISGLALHLVLGSPAPARAEIVPRLSMPNSFAFVARPILLSPGELALSLPNRRPLLDPSFPPLDLGLRTIRLVSGQNQLRFSPYIGSSEHHLCGLRIRF
jgi:hypothetical protein